MKINYVILIIFLGIFASCEKDKIDVYSAGNHIQFVKHTIDSSNCSFLAYPDRDELLFPVVVEVIGLPSSEDREYAIEVNPAYTTAPVENYTIPASLKVKAGKVTDTCWITFKKTPEISQEAKRLTVQLAATADFKLGQLDCLANIIYVSNVIAQPDWWTTTVTGSYLGAYSDKKYRLFIRETGVADIDSSNTTELRYYSIIFKNYLLREKDAGRTVMEDNGTEMVVTLMGG